MVQAYLGGLKHWPIREECKKREIDRAWNFGESMYGKKRNGYVLKLNRIWKKREPFFSNCNSDALNATQLME
ncbi:hypothetical protein NC652_032346 [Populus alba x Populus x berolinensis]|nr:hypothetical protein NC652_032346 [Populus alba x Populus x berolinensis]